MNHACQGTTIFEEHHSYFFPSRGRWLLNHANILVAVFVFLTFNALREGGGVLKDLLDYRPFGEMN